MVFITETWFTGKNKDAEVSSNLPYVIHRFDRSSGRGGGVCCVFRNTINSSIILCSGTVKSDVLCVEVPFSSKSQLGKIRCYLPSS